MLDEWLLSTMALSSV